MSGAVQGLDHIVLTVSDFEAAVGGYEALLGRSARRTAPAGGAVRAWFRLDNIALEVIAPDGAGVAGERVREQLAAHGDGLSLMAFAVDDLDAAGKRLARRGIAARPVQGSTFQALAASTDSTCGVAMVFARFEPHAPSPQIGDPAAAISGLDHVVVQTPNPERAVALYGGRLGLDLRLDRSNPDWGTRLLFFRCGGTVIEIAHTLKDGVSDGPDRLWGVSWRAPDIEAAHARLSSAGFSVSDIRTGRRPASRVFTIRDKTFGVPTIVLGVDA